MSTPYNPADPTQAAFLAAVAHGESGGNANSAMLGFGGANLAGAPTDAFGFPIWSGATTAAGPTHAAGTYQFQPATWDQIAGANRLNFQNPADQAAGAWDLAASTYAAKNSGANLETALQNGDFGGAASTLSPTWASLTATELAAAFNGNAAASAPSAAGASGVSSGTPSAPTASVWSPSTWLPALDASIKNLFVRGGVFLLALILIAFGLYYLADQQTDGKLTEALAA